MEYQYAKRMTYLNASEIRELLKITERPEILSFAGGLPAPELFPVKEFMEASRRVLEENGEVALQYSSAEGYEPLRSWIANRLNSLQGTAFDADNILITNGSQQALDLTGKVFLDEGDTVLCECPTYLAAISAFRAYGCKFEEIPTDDDGMIPEALEAAIRSAEHAKVIYTIPEFQNPTGNTWSADRRKKLAELAAKYNLVVIEDNPYGELRFEGTPLPSVKSFDQAGRVFILGTFSKILSPGYRIGWVAGEKEAIKKYIVAKQGADLQCNTLAQREISKYLELYDIDQHIEEIRKVYKNRRDAIIQAMEAEFPKSVAFTRPQGGLFTWVELPESINARDILVKCLEKNVAFVPGGSFYPNTPRENTLRINYSNLPEDKLVWGIKRIAEAIKESL